MPTSTRVVKAGHVHAVSPTAIDLPDRAFRDLVKPYVHHYHVSSSHRPPMPWDVYTPRDPGAPHR